MLPPKQTSCKPLSNDISLEFSFLLRYLPNQNHSLEHLSKACDAKIFQSCSVPMQKDVFKFNSRLRMVELVGKWNFVANLCEPTEN